MDKNESGERTVGRIVDARGIALEALAAVAAVGLVVYGARVAGLGVSSLVVVLWVASPLIGEFAVTMAMRYRPQMTIGQAAARMLWPSSCDSCGAVLSQWDILPVIPYVLRKGRCACRSFAVPPTCTVVGIATAVVASAIVAAAWLIKGDLAYALAPLVVALAYAPVVVADVIHGECDEVFLAVPALATLAVEGGHFVWALSAGAGFALFVVVSGLLVCLVRRSWTRVPFGPADVAAAFGAGAILDLQALVAALVWLCVALAASFVVVFVMAGIGGTRRYGPLAVDAGPSAGHAQQGALATPMLPAIVLSAVIAFFWHPF